MKITHIRIRKLVSRPVGYGHDAAEIEAALEEGDDPADVAARLHGQVEAEIRHGEERGRLFETLDELRDQVALAERRRDRLKGEIAEANAELEQIDGLCDLAKEHGIELPKSIAWRARSEKPS